MNNNFSLEISSDISLLQTSTEDFAIKVVSVIDKIKLSINPLKTTLKLLSEAFKETFDYALDGEQISKLVTQSGLASDKFQALSKAAQRYGGSAQETAKSVETLRKGLADIQKGGDGNGLKETLKAFNINPAGLQSADQFLEVIAGRMETLKSDTEKLDFGHALGLDDATIKTLSGGIKEYREEMEKASQNNAFSPEDMARAEELNEALRDIGTDFYDIGMNIAQVLLPVVTPLFSGIKNIIDFFASNSEMIKSMLLEIGSVLLIVLVNALGQVAVAGFTAMLPFLPAILLISALIAAFIGLNWIVGQFIAWINGKDSIFTGWLGDFETFKTGLSDGFQQIGENIVNSITAVWNFLTEFFTNIIDFVKTIVSNVVSAFGQVAQQVAHVFMGVLNAIRSAFGKVIGFVQDVVSKVLEIIPDWLKNFLMRGTVVGVVANGIVKGAKALHKNATAANGIGYVPFDGYLAELHQGESVLDKSEANIWRDLQAGKDAISTTANVPLASVPQGAITNAYQSSDVNKSFTIGDITIQTAATDADGIANDLMDSIKKAFNGLDSGVRA